MISNKNILSESANKKAELPEEPSFGSSAIFPQKTRRFPPPPHEGFGLIGKTTSTTFLSRNAAFVK